MTVIVDYGAGNITSVRLALEHLGATVTVSGQSEVVSAANRIIFPGVGAAESAMQKLQDRGLENALVSSVERGVPFLGICLGAQIIFERTEENGGIDCLGILPGSVKALPRGYPGMKVPQIGWNHVTLKHSHPLMTGIRDGSAFYFVHAFYPCPEKQAHVIAVTEYAGVEFASVTGRDNVCATQFHPERSGPDGLRLLDNFMRWDGKGNKIC